MQFLRHLAAILLLPFVAVVVVPAWLLREAGGVGLLRPGAHSSVAVVLGALLFALGFALFAWCVALFARVGKGTLAPWDPTRRLVAVGPYRRVRNPMITGVATMLAGEALVAGSGVLAAWLAAFVVVNHAYFLISEEPGLRQRFGDDYRQYCEDVPRWLPRLLPRRTRVGAA